MPTRLVSEQDFVSNFVLQEFKEAAGVLKVLDNVDFHLEKTINGGRADLVAERGGRGLFVLEAKFKKKIGRIERDIEPRDPEVIRQAVNYANIGGYSYYCTCNPKRIVLFQVVPGKKAFESEVASFEFVKTFHWAEEVLKIVLGIVPARAKPLDDSLVSALHEAFSDLYDEFLTSLKEKLQDEAFMNRFVEWLKDQGIEYDDESIKKIAEQTTYLQLNKLLFYYVVRTIYSELEPISIKEEEDVAEALFKYYKDVGGIDYSPIYQSDLISEIPFTDRAKERFRTLIDTLNEYDFSQMESDFIGRVYEKLIPPLDRKRLGQFYTPPEIVDLIVRLTIHDKNAKVLDPACGSGSFLVKAYHRLRTQNGVPKGISGPLTETFHKQFINQIYGVDINQFPAHLSVINLAIQNPKAKVDRINVIVKDFFDLKPRQETLSGFQSMATDGERILLKIPYSFDVVVANPPYIRQEMLGDKEKKKIFELIEKEYNGDVAITERKPNAIALGKTGDIYIYFYIHSLRFLRNGGRLGFISSNKWLEVSYGEPFQQFLTKNARVLYVIEFDRAVFPDAEVNTAITILEKEKDPEKRKNNSIRFVRIKKPTDQTELLKLLAYEDDLENADVRITIIHQEKLEPGKWSVYLRAPPVFKKLINHPKMKVLSKMAHVIRGPTTGSNYYFILSKQKVKEWKIEPEFLIPCVPSPKKARGLLAKLSDINYYFFMCDKPKDELEGTNALKYIEFGEKLDVEVRRGSKRGFRKLPHVETVKGRRFWYSLPNLEAPTLLLPKLIDKRIQVIWNNAEAQASDLFYYITPNKEDALVLLGFLNSSIGALLSELYGRSYGGGVLDLKVYEVEQIPVLSPSTLSKNERACIEDAFKRLAEVVEKRVKLEEEFERFKSKSVQERGLFENDSHKKLELISEQEKDALEELDKAIYDVLGLTEKERKQVCEGLKELQEMRVARTKT